jgi:hypothetical protein
MATKRAILTPLIAGCALLASPLLAGCPALSGIQLPGLPMATPKPKGATETTSDVVINAPDASSLLIKGTIKGPAALGDGTKIAATEDDSGGVPGFDASASGDASGAAGYQVFRGSLLATNAVELPIQNAMITVKGYDFKIIPQLLAKPSDENGEFYFRYVPARISFFLDAQFAVNGKSYRMLGLTRTQEPGTLTQVTVDMATTLTARELLRIWQLSDYRIEYKDLSPKDFNPLVLALRQELKNGMPAGLMKAEDVLAGVKQPDGKWAIESDREDAGVVTLDALARRSTTVSREIERLYKAANYLLSHDLGAKDQVTRPPSLK